MLSQITVSAPLVNIASGATPNVSTASHFTNKIGFIRRV